MAIYQETEDYLLTLVRHSPFGIIVLDLSYHVKLINSHSSRYIDSSAPLKKIIKRSIFDAMPYDLPLVNLLKVQQQQGRKAIKGEYSWCGMRVRYFFSLLQNGLAIFLEDITEEFEKNVQLIALSESLQKKNSELHTLAQMTAHQLRSPAVSIYDLCELLDTQVAKPIEGADDLLPLLREKADALLRNLNYFSQIAELHAQTIDSDKYTSIKNATETYFSSSDHLINEVKLSLESVPLVTFNPSYFNLLLKSITTMIKENTSQYLYVALTSSGQTVRLQCIGEFNDNKGNTPLFTQNTETHHKHFLLFKLVNLALEQYQVTVEIIPQTTRGDEMTFIFKDVMPHAIS